MMSFVIICRAQILGFGLTLLISGMIAILALAPVSSKGIPGSDKRHHFVAFVALAFPLPFVRPRFFWPVLATVIFYGGMIELIQPSFGRQAEVGDLVADSLGTMVGASLGVLNGWLVCKLSMLKKTFPLQTERIKTAQSYLSKISLKAAFRLK